MNFINGTFNTCLRHHSLLQTNRTEAAQVLAMAARTGVADAAAWAARTLSLASEQGAGLPPQVVAKAIAMVEQNARSAVLAPAIERFSVAEIRQLANAMNKPRAPQAATPAAADSWRTPRQALIAYNQPDWINVRAGRVVLNASRLQGESAQAWADLTAKFGTPLTQALFDARVRAGTVSALIDVLDNAHSTHILTVPDLTRLQYLAVTDGRPGAGVAPPTLHDAFHTYGTSVREEMYGDVHTEGLVRALFSNEPDNKISLQPSLPLARQPEVVRQLKARIDADFKSVEPENLLFELRRSFYEDEPNDLGMPVYRHDWWSKPAENAARAETLFKGSGAIAHLDANASRRLQGMINGANNPDSLAAISARFERGGGYDSAAAIPFFGQLRAWMNQAFELVGSSTTNRLMSQAQYKEYAARSVALGLTLERAAPGALALGPSSTLPTLPALAAPLQNLDLRTSYPRVLREVRQALGLTP
jgi:hypothetical protein